MNEILVIPGGETIERYLESTKELPEDVSLFQANLINTQHEVTEIELFLTNIKAYHILDAVNVWLYENRRGIDASTSSLKRISLMIDQRAFSRAYNRIDELADLLSKIPIQRYPVNRNIVQLDVVFVRMDNESHKLEVVGEMITIPFTFMNEQPLEELLIKFFVNHYNIPIQVEDRMMRLAGAKFVIPARFLIKKENMYQVSNLVEGWSNFTKKAIATELLRSHCRDGKQLKQYLKMIKMLPLTFEDAIETPQHIFDGVIEFLSEGLEPIEFKKVKIHHQAIPSECHRVSLLIRLLNPEYKHYIGFATIDEVVSNDWCLHSWCVDPNGVIIEGTPLKRSRYFGKEVPFNKELHTKLFEGLYGRIGAGYKEPAKKHLYVGRKIWLLFPHRGIEGVVCRAEIVGIKKRPGMNDLISYVEKDSSGNGKVNSADACYVWTTDDLLKTLSVMQTGSQKTKRKVRRIEHAGAAIDRSGLFE